MVALAMSRRSSRMNQVMVPITIAHIARICHAMIASITLRGDIIQADVLIQAEVLVRITR